MKSTTYNPTTKIASIQPGGDWQSVYDTLAPYGVTVTGGRAGTVGVGGFITGGGNSFHAASHGFACDNVANFELVLADGSIVNANSKTNPDLFVALKGSGANFGLITRFDMNVIEFPDPKNPVIWGGNLIYDLSAGPFIIDALVDFAENVHKNENNSAIVYWAYIPAIGGMIVNAAIENTLGNVKPAGFEGFYGVPNITADTTKVDKMSVVTNELGAGQPAGLRCVVTFSLESLVCFVLMYFYRNVWFTAAFKNDARVMNYAVKKFYELNAEFETLLTPESGFNTLCMFQPITESIVEKGIKNGGNVLGLDEYIKGGNGIMFLATLAVNGAEKEALGYLRIKAYTEDIEAYAASLNVAWNWKYLNYAAKTQDSISTYGTAAIAKLKAASKKYDPKGVFQKLRLSGFKIPA